MKSAVMLDPHELRARIPDDLFELPYFRTLGKAFLLIALVFGGLAVATAVEPLWIKALLGLVLGVPLFTLAAIGHESGHRTASRSTFINDLTGTFSMSILGIPARGWKVKHDVHHRNTGVPGVDSDTGVPVSGYLALSRLGRLIVRTFNHYEWCFWPLTAFLLWSTTWNHAVKIVLEPRSRNPRVWWWNLSDMVVGTVFFGGLVTYVILLGWQNALFCVALPFGVAGVVGAATFVTNHRNLPPLDAEQQKRVAKYAYLNTRSVTFQAAVPGNYFMNYVPWQVEHHMYPTVPGFKLDKIAPHLRHFGEEKGARLNYESFWSSIRDTSSCRYAWGADGRLYRFAELDRMIVENRLGGHFSGRDGEETDLPQVPMEERQRRELLDAILMR